MTKHNIFKIITAVTVLLCAIIILSAIFILSEKTLVFMPEMKRILSEDLRTTAARPWESILPNKSTAPANRKDASNNQSPKVESAKILKTQKAEPDIPQAQREKVIRVIDGDTVEIEGAMRVRYIGINTPETVDPRTTPQCFGKEAFAKNRELVEGKTVTLEKDVSQTDKYGRLLRYVFVDQTFVNDYLVRQGFAQSSSYPPNIKYQSQFLEAQQEAQQAGRGLWSACTNQNGSNTTQYNKEGCNIKGNISSSGEKIYHMPGQKYYDKTVIDESKGEKWFCTEDEAIATGWRKSKI